ncbi:LOW QUALITY PROTEIN: hypothetical protein PanWU01x14_149600 [Parasponia andersonii]|uniref:Uncharacterized protein n=1 Tax=Parasponia andersonii TaxID=3476 RepID=A0A2P5CIG3_PARAD|nr:LOW QUALITY PROTEIN: hypothetical protein PanWU01x14_149600 [Parasponia andersonii]
MAHSIVVSTSRFSPRHPATWRKRVTYIRRRNVLKAQKRAHPMLINGPGGGRAFSTFRFIQCPAKSRLIYEIAIDGR